MVTGGFIRNADTDINPETINSDATIEITFSEDVQGNIARQTEDGEDVGWIGKVQGNKGILELIKDEELGNATTYVIVGKVAEIKITFVTRAKV